MCRNAARRRYNTKENLAALLSHGTVVGETAKFYRSQSARSGRSADESKGDAGSGAATVKCPLDLSGVAFAWDKVEPITEASANAAVEAQLAQVMEATGGALPPGMSKYMVRCCVGVRPALAPSRRYMMHRHVCAWC